LARTGCTTSTTKAQFFRGKLFSVRESGGAEAGTTDKRCCEQRNSCIDGVASVRLARSWPARATTVAATVTISCHRHWWQRREREHIYATVTISATDAAVIAIARQHSTQQLCEHCQHSLHVDTIQFILNDQSTLLFNSTTAHQLW
jgi:transposase